ncbi:MAG TPA: hypothetical protein VE288_03525 [Rubrobacteraceae bacterium]|jgi:hypothetical protein|nr:hypothetical protein [Rubrobacteraceae bacterium]
MTSYAEMAHERKRARPLYLELRALGLGLRVKEEAADPTGYELVMTGAGYLSQARADQLRRRVEESKTGLLRVLRARWDPDLEAIRYTGAEDRK